MAAGLYVVAGLAHFRFTGAYAKIVPPYVPWPTAMVYISGGAEFAGGLGLLLPQVRRTAAWGLIALLIAVFPANLYMVMQPIATGAGSIPPWLLWIRLPLQAVLIWWLLWATEERRGADA